MSDIPQVVDHAFDRIVQERQRQALRMACRVSLHRLAFPAFLASAGLSAALC